MEKKCFNLEGMIKLGPYSHAVQAGDMIYLSGVVPVNPQTGAPEADNIEQATTRVLDNIKMILDGLGSNLEKVVRVGIFLKDMADYKKMNEIYATYFSNNPPARTCVAAKELPADFSIEIEVIALK